MKITVTFDSIEEFMSHVSMGGTVQAVVEDPPVEEAVKPAETVPEEPEKPAETAPEKPAESKVDESFRLEVRKALAALNKKKTGNPAKGLIAETGYSRLTDVPLDLLPGLLNKAKEAMDA